jgi:hypothetical protein
MVNLALAWAEAYAEVTPSVPVEVSGGGSGTGIAALINGTVDIANCSREMIPEEIERVKQNTGKEPQKFIVGYDALAVYVHKNNRKMKNPRRRGILPSAGTDYHRPTRRNLWRKRRHNGVGSTRYRTSRMLK